MGLHEEPPICSLGTPPWSAKQLRRLGESVRDGSPPPARTPSYDEVMVWYDDLAAAVQSTLRSLDWESLLTGRAPSITSRSKTIDTLREKLQRDRQTPLSNVQDVAGVRFECDMTLEEQDIVAAAIAAAFDHEATCIRDIRKTPHSGYRAVHVWLRLPQGRVEIQVRTLIQGLWANAYEAAADRLGRGIRYGEIPTEPSAAKFVRALQDLSLREAARIEDERLRLAIRRRASTDRANDAIGLDASASTRQGDEPVEQATAYLIRALSDLEHVIRTHPTSRA